MTTIEQEVKHFSHLAHEWWDPEGAFKVLHKINPLRMHFIQALLIQHQLHEGSLLDTGCGGGLLTERLATSTNFKITGIDPSYESIVIAKTHAKSAMNIDYHTSTIEDFSPNFKQHFDIVCAMEVLEHTPDPGLFVKHASYMLKKGGLFFLSTINKNIKSYFQAIILAEYVLRWVPSNTHEWKKFLTPNTVYSYLNNVGITMTKIQGIKFNPLLFRWYLDDDTSVNYIAVGQKM